MLNNDDMTALGMVIRLLRESLPDTDVEELDDEIKSVAETPIAAYDKYMDKINSRRGLSLGLEMRMSRLVPLVEPESIHGTMEPIEDSVLLMSFWNGYKMATETVSVDKAAKILGLTPARVGQLIKEGEFRAKKSGKSWMIEYPEVYSRSRVFPPGHSKEHTEEHPRAHKTQSDKDIVISYLERRATELGIIDRIRRGRGRTDDEYIADLIAYIAVAQ